MKNKIKFHLDENISQAIAQGIEHYGIVYSQQKSQSIGYILQNLILIWQILEVEEMINHLEYL